MARLAVYLLVTGLITLVVGCSPSKTKEQLDSAAGTSVDTGSNQIGSLGDSVTLSSATAGFADSAEVTITWTQTGGTPVELTTNDQGSANFTAPDGDTLEFTVTATDSVSGAIASDSVLIEIPL